MQKDEALKIIVKCAELYQKNLENKNLLFLSLTKKNKVNFLEVKFLKGNYSHLTGVIITNDNINAKFFYKQCLKNKLSTNDFKFKDDGTTPLKLSVLPQLMNICNNSKIIGNFNGSKPKLYTDKLVGNIIACMGLTEDGSYYVPSTALKEDIRDLVNNEECERVIAIFSKDINSEVYNKLDYLVRGFEGVEEKKLPNDLLKKLDIENLSCSFGVDFIKANHIEQSVVNEAVTIKHKQAFSDELKNK